ncbi:hypothetical protein [Salinigranum salinum]|uniref:hypothetical protein n=1 Tax=Salinigranum salinum TaxID=1364937 RepID=UPI001260472E|nr:hypothetical protein [Salinigranum salinum]
MTDADDSTDADDTVSRLANNPPGFDEEDPYADTDVDALPSWWRQNLESFRDHEMRPYRPPTFADGTVLPERVETLESELGVEIRLRKRITSDADEGWTLFVDRSPVAHVERVRNEEGRSVYEIAADEFEALVRDAVDDSPTPDDA